MVQDDILGLVHLGCHLANSLQFQAIRHGQMQKPEETIAVSAPTSIQGPFLVGLKAASEAFLIALESLAF
jgi:hypothetical protein